MTEDVYTREVNALMHRFPSVQNTAFAAAYKPGLEHMVQFSERLGGPQRKFCSIHIAGTNGKGSVSSMLSSALSAAGYKTGLFTSPHLSDFRERAKIIDSNGCTLIPKEFVYDFLIAYKSDFEELDLSFFEITTALAFSWFAQSGVDAAVIETGLGGLLDSTNIIVPSLSVITGIGLDHCAWLGDTLDKIAAQKGGIFKKDVPALVYERDSLSGVFERIAESLPCPLFYADESCPMTEAEISDILQRMDLRGKYQRKNLRTAIAALSLLEEDFPAIAGSSEIIPALIHTAARIDFHGRWERLRLIPEIICDIGHNPQAMGENCGQLQEILDSGKKRSLIIIYGVMADKDLSSILPLFPTEARLVFTTPRTPRALPSEAIMEQYLAYCRASSTVANAVWTNTVGQAIEYALSVADAAQTLIFIGGSTFVVSDALDYFKTHSI